MIRDLLNFDRLSDAQRARLAAKLDRMTARFAYGVIGAVLILFAFHGVRWLIQSGVLS